MLDYFKVIINFRVGYILNIDYGFSKKFTDSSNNLANLLRIFWFHIWIPIYKLTVIDLWDALYP